ncbi:MAG: M48 family metallopeptidase [Kangiellaceae bacterium]|nr:M48 family metallopeptidase [Kangiellaceae bacterium]
MDFFEHQEAARKKTKLLIFYFIVAVILIVAALNLVAYFALKMSSTDYMQLQLTDWFNQEWFYYTSGATLTMIAGGSGFRWLQLRGGGKAVAQMVNAREVLPDTNDRLEQRLLNVVEEMSIASGTAVPTVYIMDQEEAINAFVAGQETSDTIMVVTRGALEKLNRQELQGVVAHEYSHIFNADMKINVKLISILAGILILGQAGYFIMRSIRHGNVRSNNKEGGGIIAVVIIVGLSMYIIGSIGLFFGRLIKAAISRQREFLADASAVQYARDNEGLAGAFIKIGEQSSLLSNRHAEETSHMCIAEPIKLSFSGLATHPPIEKRLDAIMPHWREFKDRRDRRTDRHQRYAEQDALRKEREAKRKKDFGFGPLIDTVGKPTTLHMHAASALLLAMPEILKTAAHGHHTTAHAMHLIFALLLSDDGQIEEESLQEIQKVYGDDSRHQVLKLAKYITKDKRYLRLAILDISIPSIRRLSETERKDFFSLLKRIIHLDKHVSQFEYVLYALLKKSLTEGSTQSRKRITRFDPVREDLQRVISAVVHSSGNTLEQKQLLFTQVSAGFSSHTMSLSENKFDAESFNESLMRLNQLTPMLKKPLLNALEEAIKEDNIVKAEEVELLRAIAECLDCPIPPTVEEMQKQAIEVSEHSKA